VTADDLLRLTDAGLYCPAGDFHIDPWRPVDRAVVTHAHADHCRWGCGAYLVCAAGETVYRARLGAGAALQTVPYGRTVTRNRVRVSFHPAGHVLGSAQVCIESGGKVAVVSGDYKTEPDPTCLPFEPVRCHLFLTESTFGLPVYRWPKSAELHAEINAWWRANREAGRASLLYGYALGKAQRLLAGLDPEIGPIFTHGAVGKLNDAYRAAGVPLPPTSHATAVKGFDWAGALVLAPPSVHGTPWTRKFGTASSAFASGWMAIRGTRRRKAVDRGFVVSDHADWPGLLWAVRETGAGRVLVTHGYSAVLARWLREQGLDADVLATRYEGESGAEATEEGMEPEGD
jgi:putative mRNA 3-end processing factor